MAKPEYKPDDVVWIADHAMLNASNAGTARLGGRILKVVKITPTRHPGGSSVLYPIHARPLCFTDAEWGGVLDTTVGDYTAVFNAAELEPYTGQLDTWSYADD